MEFTLKKKLILFLLLNGFYFFSYFHRVGIPGTIFNELQIDFNLTAKQVANLGAIVFYIYGFLQFFIGPCLDYFGTNRILIIGGLLLCVGSFLFSFSSSIFDLYLSRIIVGFGASVAYLIVVKKSNELFGPSFFSLMLGIGLFLGYTGGLFATFPFERLVYIFGWRNSIFWLTIILFFVILIIFLFFIKNHQFGYQKNLGAIDDMKKIILNKTAYPIILVQVINFTIYFLFQGIIGKKLLQDTCNISSKIAASFTFFMMATTMFFVLFWGAMAHLVRNNKNLVISMCVVSIFSCILMLLNIMLLKKLFIFLISLFLFACVGGSGVVTTTLIKRIAPTIVGTTVGFINGMCYISVAIFGNITGFILDKFYSMATITSDAVIYPSGAYTILVGLCILLSLFSFIASFKIVEERKHTELDIPLPL